MREQREHIQVRAQQREIPVGAGEVRQLVRRTLVDREGFRVNGDIGAYIVDGVGHRGGGPGDLLPADGEAQIAAPVHHDFGTRERSADMRLETAVVVIVRYGVGRVIDERLALKLDLK